MVHPDAAGMDVHSEFHFVAVPAGRAAESVRRFGAFTEDLERLADGLQTCGVRSVAMESTGVYWIPLFELLERRGFQVILVDPRKLKSVPGRKSDVQDCQWLQQWHTFGLLAAAFRPDESICVLRAYLRQRALLVEQGTQHIQHLQKSLTQMNLKLDRVLSDITGVTGMLIIDAILNGERHPLTLAALRDERCRHDEATIAKALDRDVAGRAPLHAEAGPRTVPDDAAPGRGVRCADRGAPAIAGRPSRPTDRSRPASRAEEAAPQWPRRVRRPTAARTPGGRRSDAHGWHRHQHGPDGPR